MEIERVILADQAKSLDWQKRRATFICEVPEETVHRVLRRIEALLKIMESFDLEEILEDLLERFGYEKVMQGLRDLL